MLDDRGAEGRSRSSAVGVGGIHGTTSSDPPASSSDLPASSSPHAVRLPFSVEEAVDPEEALVASAASCHMLTFLWVAAKKGFLIESYEDNAVGEMTTTDDGRQWISKITLDPQIVWGDKTPTSDELTELHHEAHAQCYIANSIKSEVVVK